MVTAAWSQHRPNPLFDSAVVLFDEIAQVLARSHFYSTRKFPVSFISRTARCDAAYASCVILVGVRRFFIALRRKILAAVTSRFRLGRNRRSSRPYPRPDTGRPNCP